MSFTGKATYSAGANLPEIAEDVSDIIGIVSPYETALLDHLGDPHRTARSTVHEWLEDQLLPNTDTINDAAIADPDGETTFTVANGSRFRAGDQIQIQGAREVMFVTAVAGNDLTVARGYGGTTPEDITDGDTIRILGNAALEGDDAPSARFTNRSRKPEAEYARSSSSNFSTFANVFRSWVLNEDGWYTSEPYNQTQAFDLANFFNQPHLRPQPLRLRDCLTLDDAGKSLPPIVEISIDAGVTWSQYPGKADVLADRVGVYFADDQLPAGFIAAAQAGDARVRITGTLTSPESTQIARWQGNAFAGTLLPRQLDVADSFIFRKVSSTSIHAADVATGARQAMEHDDTLTMEHWLIQQMQRSNTHALGAGQGRLELAGCWPQLRIGDQLFDAAGQAKDITNHATAVLQQGVTVTAISHELDSARSTANPRTRVDVRF